MYAWVALDFGLRVLGLVVAKMEFTPRASEGAALLIPPLYRQLERRCKLDIMSECWNTVFS